MILFPLKHIEITTSFSILEAEKTLSEQIVKKQLKGYHGSIGDSRFKLGCARFLKIPVSEIRGQMEDQESGSILKASVRPTYVQFIFPIIFAVLAFSRIAIDFSQFIQIMLLSIIMVGALMVLYRYSLNKDLAFIDHIFKADS